MSYWNEKGKYQHEYNELWKNIPSYGEVEDEDYAFLEFLRMFSTIYYRFFNDGERPGYDEDYKFYFEELLHKFYLFQPFLGEHLKSHIYNGGEGLKSIDCMFLTMFPWIWNEETLDLFMDAIVLYSLDCEKKMKERLEHEKKDRENKDRENKESENKEMENKEKENENKERENKERENKESENRDRKEEREEEKKEEKKLKIGKTAGKKKRTKKKRTKLKSLLFF